MIPLSKILVVTDCDGTLLRNDKSISSGDLDAIHEFVRLGGNFTIATGRSLPTSVSILKKLPLKLPIILYNGSMLYDPVKQESLWMAEIPHAAKFVVQKAMEFYGPSLGVEVLTPEALHVLQFTSLIDEHLNGKLQAEYRMADYAEVLPMHWLKVMFALPEKQMDTFRDFLEGLHADGIRYVRSEKLYFEILPAEASKGEALQQLCAHTGLSLDYTAAIGDCDNDLEMLQTAAAGFAVANAYPSVRERARYTTVSNEESAVAAVIKEIQTDSGKYFPAAEK